MGEVTGVVRSAVRGRAAPAVAWALAAGAVAVATGMALTVPGEVPVLRGLPRTSAWASVAALALGVAAGGQRVAPFAAVVVTLAATAAVVSDGGPVGAAAIGIGAAGWLCLELTASSLEARARCRRSPATVLGRAGVVAGVALGGSVVSLAALTVTTDATAGKVVLQGLGVVAAVGLVALVAWLVHVAADGR